MFAQQVVNILQIFIQCAGNDCGNLVNIKGNKGINFAIWDQVIFEQLYAVAKHGCGQIVNRKIDGEIKFAKVIKKFANMCGEIVKKKNNGKLILT